MTPPKYAYAAAKALLANGGRIHTGWSVGTLAAVESQKAIYLLRRDGVDVSSKRVRQGVYAYSIQTATAWARCKRIVAEWERAHASIA